MGREALTMGPLAGLVRTTSILSTVFPLLRTGVLALAAAALWAPAAHADVKSGVDAWSAGDYAAAVAQWQPLAERGDPDAQFNLAQAYKLGRGVPLDLARAEELYGKAAAKGHLQAADAYGLLLFQRGERTRALPYVQGSAARGDPRAQYILGVAHFNGDIVPKDWVRAYALVSLAQQAGLPQAANAKAQMDQHIALAERQKSVVLAQQIAAQAQANRARLNTSAELGTRLAAAGPEPEVAPARIAAPQGPRVADAERPVLPAPPPPRHPPRPVPTPAPPPAPRPAIAKPRVAPAPRPAVGSWRVQLGAFGVAGNADALWAKVRGRPELSGHPKALAPAGKLVKLQATGFASKADADAACARLSAGGFGCLPVRD
jgi:cell division septation protein DedD